MKKQSLAFLQPLIGTISDTSEERNVAFRRKDDSKRSSVSMHLRASSDSRSESPSKSKDSKIGSRTRISDTDKGKTLANSLSVSPPNANSTSDSGIPKRSLGSASDEEQGPSPFLRSPITSISLSASDGAIYRDTVDTTPEKKLSGI